MIAHPGGLRQRLDAPRPELDSGLEEDYIRLMAGRRDASPRAKPPPKPTILVVDDEADLTAMLRRLLSPDFQVFTAADGREAVRLFHELKPRLVLLDVELPGLRGPEVLKAIVGDGRGACVVMMSGCTHLQTARAMIKMGARDYVVKPFDPDSLKETLRSALAAAPPQRR
jgi:DNA-binding response OmpR family regulator